ncbi:MAG TPA: RHS repeat-associated core domain-containing protein [Anaerolineales bacterium]|nr:RHS repeat-associated core domain-containing protein [Anaerolineales bacterium]
MSASAVAFQPYTLPVSKVSGARNYFFGLYCLKSSIALGSPATFINFLTSQTRGTTTRYFLQDGQGSTRALTNTSSPATVTDSYSYNAFGDLATSSGTTVNSYRYTGQQFDSLTGLYDLRARYYNPALGRFLSQDTYPVEVGNPVELNRYGYTGNNPINGMDPSGYSDTAEYAMPLGTFSALGWFGVTDFAVYTAGVLAVTAAVVLLTPTVNAPPRPMTWQDLKVWPGDGGSSPRGPQWGRVVTTAVTILTLLSMLASPNAVQNMAETSQETREEPKPEYIYRDGPDTPKRLRLYRPEDYRTGLSFWDHPVLVPYVKFRVSILEANGYVVIRDGDGTRFFTELSFFGGGQAFGIPVTIPVGHVTVYRPPVQYWQEWYIAELKIDLEYTNAAPNTKKPLSPQTLALYALREK